MQRNKPSKIGWTILVAMSILLGAIIISSALDFQQYPSITPISPDTTNNLTCSWQITDATEVNVSWFVDDVLFLNETVLVNYSIIPNTSTNKNQVWKCNVTATNSSSTISYEANTTVINKAPYEPSVYNTTSSLGYFMMLHEDTTYTFDINGTDADEDVLYYSVIPSNSFCTTTDPDIGTVICTPTRSNLILNGTQELIGQKNITFKSDDLDPYRPFGSGHTILFNISPVNDAPNLTQALTNKNTWEGSIFNYVIEATDEEENVPFNFSITVNASINLVINQTGNKTAIIMFSNNDPASYQIAGNYTVNVTIKDSLNASIKSNFILQITQNNTAPVLRPVGLLNATQGNAFSFLFYSDDLDENESRTNFTISSDNCAYGDIWDNITINITNAVGSTNATGNITISNLTNEHVVCSNFTVVVRDDAGVPDSEDVFLNITNTNDPPIVQVQSSHYNNTAGQTNLTNMSAYANALFIYMVNATDVDSYTYEGEVLTYTDNTTLFNIDGSTGAIIFTPTGSDIGSYEINITVTDQNMSSDSKTMNLFILNNSVPVLNPIGNVNCTEGQTCFVYINATDADNDNLTFSSNNSIFNITDNTSTNPIIQAYVNFTPAQAGIGNYSIRVSVTDARGASDYEDITFQVSNINDAPTVSNFTFPYAVATHPVGFNVYANDEDYQLQDSSEYVNFSVTNLSGKLLFNITTFTNESNQTYGWVYFEPGENESGTYTVQFIATDTFNETGNLNMTFTILSRSQLPNITHVKPYRNDSSGTPIYDYIENNYTNNQMEITINENTTIVFDINVTDDTPANDLNYSWSLDGTVVSNNKSITRTFDFFSNGRDDYVVVVNDTMLENATFRWNITIVNVNRPPVLLSNFTNRIVNGTTSYDNYFLFPPRFLDPDDDLDSSNALDGDEINTLTYTVSSCAVATITINNQTLNIEPTAIGTCNVTFTATDAGLASLASNTITINTTQVEEDQTVIETPVSSSGGGGNSRKSPIPIPITRQDLKPQAIEIVVPDIVTVYENRTVIIPVTVQNTWNTSLKGVSVNATSESEELKFRFSENFFLELKKGEKKNISLYVNDYRMGEDYKIKIYANVTDPKASDSAYVFLNTIEQSKTGEDVQTKVTFAQDLLNENPECLELNELLEKAKETLGQGDDKEALKMVDGVIEGCKYLVSVSKKQTQQPETILQKALKPEYRTYLIAFISLCALSGITITLLKKRNAIAKKKNAEDKIKKTEDTGKIKPYWPT